MRRTRRAAAIRLPLIAFAALSGALLVGCASDADAGGGIDLLGDGGGEGTGSWPTSVPRPDLTLVEETDLLIAFTATYDLGGGSVDAYVAELESEGFTTQGQSTYGDGSHVVLLEVEGDRLYVTITDA
ncbi:hypothetical protein GCM10009846_27850 [Agrococcus versicolor]|uniref:Uncharacterized protein n=1 Tax=Agrococcus versicolor TaxID=501482 RepID=A0ABN3AXK6_9MICO